MPDHAERLGQARRRLLDVMGDEEAASESVPGAPSGDGTSG